ncbi:MAG: autotransporter domain-containing protein, partial [Phycisphaerae bacterium]
VTLDRDILLTADSKFDADDFGQINGVISGPGGLEKDGFMHLLLAANNTYEGDTVITQGRLQPLVDNALPTSTTLVMRGGSLNLGDCNQEVAAITGTHGIIYLDGEVLTAPVVNTGSNFNDDVGGGTLRVQSGTISGQLLEDFTLEKTGPGTLDLTEPARARAVGAEPEDLMARAADPFSGHVDIQGGTLLVGDEAEDVLGDGLATMEVRSGATLGGAGTFGGRVTVRRGGIVAPGRSIGTLTVVDYAPQSGSYLDIEVAPAANPVAGVDNDQLVVTGTAELNGTVRVTTTASESAYVEGAEYTILAMSNADYSGEFEDLSTAIYEWSLNYDDPRSVILRLDSVAKYSDYAENSTQSAVAKQLDAFKDAGATGDMQTVLNKLDALSAPHLAKALGEMSPQDTESVGQAQRDSSRAVTGTLRQHLGAVRARAARGDNGGSWLDYPQLAMAGSEQDALALVSPPSPDAGETHEGPYAVWFRTISNFGDQPRTDRTSGFRSQTHGVTVGGDVEVMPGLRAGAMVGYTNSFLDLFSAAGTNEIDTLRLAAYASWARDGFYVDAAAGYGYSWYEGKRNLSMLGRTAENDHAGQEYFTFLATGYDFHVGEFTFGPVASVQYTHVEEDGYRESGAGAMNLDVDAVRADSLQTTVGLRAMMDHRLPWATLTPQLRAEWLHEYRSEARSLSARFGGAGSSFVVRGQDPAADVFLLNAGLGLDFLNGLSAQIGYEFYTECGDGMTSHGISASLRYEF